MARAPSAAVFLPGYHWIEREAQAGQSRSIRAMPVRDALVFSPVAKTDGRQGAGAAVGRNDLLDRSEDFAQRRQFGASASSPPPSVVQLVGRVRTDRSKT